ncbi:AI-2E family transporter [Patescibacteria group bacterium]|nr:AI-2E family transporter [Patescibacteria group bacterium]MBU2158905.1 AI-2E family transporter [Patescibacteria group bacterium]MBU2220568.1 AI-2E family transporter [Patescibacteria group bacterium]
MHKNVSITITPGTIITAILIGAAAFALWTLRDLALLVLTAIVIASAIEPGVAFFRKRRIPRVLAVTGMYVAVFGSLFAIVYFFLPPVLDDAQGFLSTAPQYLDTLNIPAPFSALTTTARTAAAPDQAQSIFDTLFAFQSAFADTTGGAVRVLSTFFGGIFALILVVVLSFYFAIQETGIDDFVRLMTPAKHEDYVVGLWLRAKKKIGQWMQGQLLLSIIVGVIVYLGLLILGVPYALLLAVIAAILDLIPIFGSFIAGILGVVVAFASGGVTLAVIVAGLFFIVNQFEAHLIYPLVVNKVVGIPPLLVILALIVGGSLAGFLGVLLSIPLAAALREFLGDVERKKHIQL